MTNKPEIKQTPRQLVTERALKYAKENLQKIEVKPGKFMGNQKCYHNARGYLEFQDTGTVIAACIAFVPETRGANLHFLNKINDQYIDNTLGYQANFIEYFLIREFTKEQLDVPGNLIGAKIIDELTDEILNKLFTFEERVKFDIKRTDF